MNKVAHYASDSRLRKVYQSNEVESFICGRKNVKSTAGALESAVKTLNPRPNAAEIALRL